MSWGSGLVHSLLSILAHNTWPNKLSVLYLLSTITFGFPNSSLYSTLDLISCLAIFIDFFLVCKSIFLRNFISQTISFFPIFLSFGPCFHMHKWSLIANGSIYKFNIIIFNNIFTLVSFSNNVIHDYYSIWLLNGSIFFCDGILTSSTSDFALHIITFMFICITQMEWSSEKEYFGLLLKLLLLLH